MPFGILDCKRMEVVPGTAFMSDQDELPPEYSDIAKEQLKHGKGRYRDVILVPQPSDNPNDPLNWAQWRKEVVLLIVSLTAAVVGAYGPMLSPGFVQVSAELHITVEILSQATAWLTLTIGLSLFLTNPLAKMIGRRPIYVASVAILLASSVWGAAVTHYGSFLASRVVAGVGMAPFEVLVQCTIGDLYFVHERATRIAVWNLFLLAGIAGGSLISGYTIEHDGYRWTFGVCAVLFGLLMVAIVLLVPETAFRRHAGPAVPVPVPVPVLVDGAPHSASEKGAAGGTGGAAGVSTDVVAVQEKKHTFLRSLRVFTGRYTDAPMCKIFVRPVVMWFYPAVLWGFLVYGTSITWIVVFSVVNGVIFVAPPYNFTVSQTGLISLSPLVLTVLGEAVSGPLNDWVCVRLTRANRGVYEPEFRLPLMAVSVVLGAVGFFGFGATVAAQTHWTGPVLCFGLANMSLVFGATCVFGYIIDSYRSHNEEAFVAINSRNLLTFGMTYFVNSWLAAQGTLVVFSMLGALFLFVCLLTVPLW
ncbi:major facilitator superfamily domain-containing protein [Coniella lustricola]|uniref:Major facilitator superfamily domain-containing protein n=1 Tax=Coniella lustricola TaxID=2025994 RepID=A0A2T2ZUF9_9PEZI|nr:major facilitator superfamily domain-containing protein [Coniella lustricola]